MPNSLCTDVTNIRDRLIPDLRRDLLQGIDTSIKEALARLPDVQTATVQTNTLFSCPLPAATTDLAAATEVPVDKARYKTNHMDGHTAKGDGDHTTKPMVHSPSHGDDGHTTDTTWSGVTVPHVTPGGGDTSTYHLRSNGPTRSLGFHDNYHTNGGPTRSYGFDDTHCPDGDYRSRSDGIAGVNRSVDIDHSDDFHGNIRSEGSRPPPLNMPPDQRGSPIVSPRASNRERLACVLKTSHFDKAMLAHSKYHGGTDGLAELTINFIHERGYEPITVEAPEDNLICYNDIILVHQKVVAGWTNFRTGRSGPTVEYILKKALVNFPKLRSLDAQAAVDF